MGYLEQAHAFIDRLKQAGIGDFHRNLPNQLLLPAAALIGGEEITAVAYGMGCSDDGWNGNLLVVTPSRFVLLTATNAKKRDPNARSDNASAGAVGWSRSDLVAVKVSGPDRAWYPHPEEWPQEATMTLEFAHRKPITLPYRRLDDKREIDELGVLLDSLNKQMQNESPAPG